MAVNKVVRSDGTTLIDLTSDTVTSANHIMEGYVGHLADGTSVEGTGTISASQQASLDALVRYSNEVTGENDADISEAVTTLINNFRKGDSSSVFWKTVTIQEDHTTYGVDSGVVYWKEYLGIPDEDLQNGYIFFCDILNNNDTSGWGKWMSGFYHALDGNIGCLFYRNSYDSTPVFIYDNEYAFFATTGTIVNIYRFRLDPNEGKSFWVKPRQWPDIESIDIPDDLDYDVRYLLYDKSCGVDEVSFLADTKMTVYKGTVVDGIFIGDEQSNNITSFTDTLTERFTVYKITGGNNFRFRKGVSNAYASSIQSLVWKYGKIPSTAYIGGSSENSAPWSIHTERVKLLNGINLLQLTLPTENTLPLKSLELGVKKNGDFTGRLATSGLTRGGNGILFHQHPDDKNPLVIKNLKMNFSGNGRFCQLNNVIFDNVELSFVNQNFQSSRQLRSVKFINSNVACTNMYYQFESCINLVNCDLSEVDFSTCTNSGNAFTNCFSLKNLKLNNTWKMALNLARCFSLTKESILDIFNVLPTLSEGESFTITLPYGMKNYLLTEEEKAIVTNKGWTIA